jgi:hypothetical protein
MVKYDGVSGIPTWLLLPDLCQRFPTQCNNVCHAPFHEGCLKHHGHNGDPGVTPRTCGAGGKKVQVIIVWMKALGVGNASHPQGLGVMRVRP